MMQPNLQLHSRWLLTKHGVEMHSEFRLYRSQQCQPDHDGMYGQLMRAS